MAQRQQQKRTLGPAAGFFSGITTGRENSAIRAEAEMDAQAKLRSAMLSLQKRDDTVLSGVRDDVQAIQTELQDATPETMQGITDRMNYLMKTVAPEMLPDEWFARSNEGFTPSDASSAEAGAPVGGLVPNEFQLGDPKAGAERLKAGGLRRVTKSEMQDFNTAQDGRITSDMGSYKKGTKVYKVMGYGSQVAMNKDMFMRESYGTAVKILTMNGTQSISDGMNDGETWQKVKAGLYQDADANRIDPDVAKKLVDRFEQGRKDRQAGVKSQIDIENSIINTVGRRVDGWFGIERGINGEILRFTKGSQPLFLALEKRLYSEVAAGNTSPSQILGGLHIAAESWAQASDGQEAIFDPATLRSTGEVRVSLGSNPQYGQNIENIAPNVEYDEAEDVATVFDASTGTAYFLYGEEEITGAYNIAKMAQLDLAVAADQEKIKQGLHEASITALTPTPGQRRKQKVSRRVDEVYEGLEDLVSPLMGLQQYDANGDPIPAEQALETGLMKLLLGGGNY